MKPKRIMLLICTVLTGVLLLLWLISLELRAPSLKARQGTLKVDSAACEDALYMLAGWVKVENGYVLTIFMDSAKELCLYLPGSNERLYMNGVDAWNYALGKYSMFMLKDVPADGAGYHLFLAAGETQMPYLYLGGIEQALYVMQRRIYQRMFVVGVSAAALLYCTALFVHKRSEKYLIAFMALALITVLRTARQAFPQMDNYLILRYLNPNILKLPFLPSWGNSMLYNLAHSFLLSWLRYKMADAFTPVRIGKYPYIVYMAAGSACLALLFVLGIHYETTILLNALLTAVGYCLELIVFVRAYYSHARKGTLTLIVSCICAVSMWVFAMLHQTLLLPGGTVMTQWGVNGILQTVYMLGFLVAISGKFAQKFEEADILSHELEQANEDLERSVAEKTRELQISYAHLQDTQIRKDEFVANIAHNLKTPLFSLAGFADILKSEVHADPEKAYMRADKISKSASYIKGVLDNLFLSMRLEDSKIVFHEEVFALSDMLMQLRDTCTPKAEERGVQIHLQIQGEMDRYKGDSFYLRQAVQNIMDNAIEHCAQGGHINLTLTEDAAGFCIAIRDDGDGILAEDLPRIFDRYYSKPTNGHRGSGIGLAIARDIVAAHGGKIQVESASGQGSTFRVFLAQ